MNDPQIIVALDYDNQQDVINLVEQLDSSLCRLKIGKELFTACGPDIVKRVQDLGFDVFLDLKFHDIPNTVAKACLAAAKLGVWMMNVHASGGEAMMRAAKEALDKNFDHPPLLIAVTVLTSMSEKEFGQLGYQRGIENQVKHLALSARASGLDGVVCSAREAEMLSKQLGEEFVLVTPGIRPAGSAQGDQSRVMTPAKAIMAGASHLVIGRPITQSDHPLTSLCEISETIASV